MYEYRQQYVDKAGDLVDDLQLLKAKKSARIWAKLHFQLPIKLGSGNCNWKNSFYFLMKAMSNQRRSKLYKRFIVFKKNQLFEV